MNNKQKTVFSYSSSNFTSKQPLHRNKRLDYEHRLSRLQNSTTKSHSPFYQINRRPKYSEYVMKQSKLPRKRTFRGQVDPSLVRATSSSAGKMNISSEYKDRFKEWDVQNRPSSKPERTYSPITRYHNDMYASNWKSESQVNYTKKDIQAGSVYDMKDAAGVRALQQNYAKPASFAWSLLDKPANDWSNLEVESNKVNPKRSRDLHVSEHMRNFKWHDIVEVPTRHGSSPSQQLRTRTSPLLRDLPDMDVKQWQSEYSARTEALRNRQIELIEKYRTGAPQQYEEPHEEMIAGQYQDGHIVNGTEKDEMGLVAGIRSKQKPISRSNYEEDEVEIHPHLESAKVISMTDKEREEYYMDKFRNNRHNYDLFHQNDDELVRDDIVDDVPYKAPSETSAPKPLTYMKGLESEYDNKFRWPHAVHERYSSPQQTEKPALNIFQVPHDRDQSAGKYIPTTEYDEKFSILFKDPFAIEQTKKEVPAGIRSNKLQQKMDILQERMAQQAIELSERKRLARSSYNNELSEYDRNYLWPPLPDKTDGVKPKTKKELEHSNPIVNENDSKNYVWQSEYDRQCADLRDRMQQIKKLDGKMDGPRAGIVSKKNPEFLLVGDMEEELPVPPSDRIRYPFPPVTTEYKENFVPKLFVYQEKTEPKKLVQDSLNLFVEDSNPEETHRNKQKPRNTLSSDNADHVAGAPSQKQAPIPPQFSWPLVDGIPEPRSPLGPNRNRISPSLGMSEYSQQFQPYDPSKMPPPVRKLNGQKEVPEGPFPNQESAENTIPWRSEYEEQYNPLVFTATEDEENAAQLAGMATAKDPNHPHFYAYPIQPILHEKIPSTNERKSEYATSFVEMELKPQKPIRRDSLNLFEAPKDAEENPLNPLIEPQNEKKLSEYQESYRLAKSLPPPDQSIAERYNRSKYPLHFAWNLVDGDRIPSQREVDDNAPEFDPQPSEYDENFKWPIKTTQTQVDNPQAGSGLNHAKAPEDKIQLHHDPFKSTKDWQSEYDSQCIGLQRRLEIIDGHVKTSQDDSNLIASKNRHGTAPSCFAWNRIDKKNESSDTNFYSLPFRGQTEYQDNFMEFSSTPQGRHSANPEHKRHQSAPPALKRIPFEGLSEYDDKFQFSNKKGVHRSKQDRLPSTEHIYDLNLQRKYGNTLSTTNIGQIIPQNKQYSTAFDHMLQYDDRMEERSRRPRTTTHERDHGNRSTVAFTRMQPTMNSHESKVMFGTQLPWKYRNKENKKPNVNCATYARKGLNESMSTRKGFNSSAFGRSASSLNKTEKFVHTHGYQSKLPPSSMDGSSYNPLFYETPRSDESTVEVSQPPNDASNVSQVEPPPFVSNHTNESEAPGSAVTTLSSTFGNQGMAGNVNEYGNNQHSRFSPRKNISANIDLTMRSDRNGVSSGDDDISSLGIRSYNNQGIDFQRNPNVLKANRVASQNALQLGLRDAMDISGDVRMGTRSSPPRSHQSHTYSDTKLKAKIYVEETVSNPVLMHRRYPYNSDKQLNRWLTETKDSYKPR